MVASSTTLNVRNKLFMKKECREKYKTTFTKQAKKSLTLLTRNQLHVPSNKILKYKWRIFVTRGN